MITVEQLKEEYSHAKDEVLEALVNSLDSFAEKYEINTPLRLAHFLAQTAHESGGFRAVEENLNYSADSLSKIFHKYFTDVDPAEYARQPEKIANRVYANRMGNGDEESGEGYMFRGRGLIQLTGKNNYSHLAEDLGKSLEETVEYLHTPEGACESAAWFWNKNHINALADEDNCTAVTKKINGGTIGLEDRQAHTEKFKELLGV